MYEVNNDNKRECAWCNECNIVQESYNKGIADATRWIPVSERLPEEKINEYTEDFYEYQVTFRIGDFRDIRHYKYGKGHWWHFGGIMDDYVIAWMPLPQPYREEQKK